MGVVSGIVMSYQFGTNWSEFSTKAGGVIGPLMAYEVLTAFFLEAGFLGVMLFGLAKVGKKLHFAATCMVALGTFISAFWILSVNSGCRRRPASSSTRPAASCRATAGGRSSTIPASPIGSSHTVIAAYLTTSLVVGAVGAWHLLRDRADAHARKMFSMAMWMRPSWRRCRSSRATSMDSTRWSISRPRSWPWKAIIRAIRTARP